ncbi:MAG TPA: UvrD-helicase domain-containing protein, partial [Geminicoccaceae bacterium]|nr:UvrD-helicase domain-containing protein [Geminicoccaceae bacterium]
MNRPEAVAAATVVVEPDGGPTEAQRRAADPATSAWVTANAGTGKTRVLADRVLRLMLAGTPPQRILCITFTKAAAAEMTDRIERSLGVWATEPSRAALAGSIERLTGARPSDAELARARRLFALVLDLSGGLRISTVHAFCQSLLRRFPLEAGVAPHFEVIDDRTAAEVLREAREEVLRRRDPEIEEALTMLAVSLGEGSLNDGLAEVLAGRGRLVDLQRRHGGLAGVLDRVGSALGVSAHETERGLVEAACRDDACDLDGLRAAVRALDGGSKTDGERAAEIALWLNAHERERFELFERYRGAFLTNDGEARRSL